MPSAQETSPLAYRTRPEPGQLVEVRRRQWVVKDVLASALSSGQSGFLGGPSTSDGGGQNLVTLSSIDEDGLGEEIEVIWEIEPGAQIIERAGLPTMTGQDDSDTLEAFLDAVRWGAATNADRGFLQAPFRSGVTIEDFQLDPLVRAIDMARVNLLIADDVGLGKTIEAGLVIQEMLLRHRARTVLVVCPASLQLKWQLEMREKFGLDFEIVDTAYIRRLRRERGIHANPWTSHPRLITSMDWAKSGEGLRGLKDVLPPHVTYPRKFDLLVVDEAHNVAPVANSASRYALASLRTNLVRLISPHFQHRLFLTATPHNGFTESFTSLLELLDDQRFSRSIEPDEKLLDKIRVRRLKSDLRDAQGNLVYAQRKLEPLFIRYTAEERRIHGLLEAYCNSRELQAKKAGRTGASFINRLLKKRLFSSPAAFASTLEKHFATMNDPKSASGGQINGENERRRGLLLRKVIERTEEEQANDADAEEAYEEATVEASRQSLPLTGEQADMLNELRKWAQYEQHREDSKARALLDWLDKHIKPGGAWSDKRVILFTEFRTTLSWMEKILANRDLGGERLEILHGGVDPDERERIKAAFQADPRDSGVRILLATDAASEGIDLQNHCNLLIHLEIPYNPNVMEQRNGRIDRHGQRCKEVYIWHPVDGPEKGQQPVGGHGEDIVRALRKLETMRADMGSVNPVIAPQMSDLLEGKRIAFDTSEAEAKMLRARRSFVAERDVQERIKKCKERLSSSQEDFHLTPLHIFRAVQTGLALARQPLLEPTALQRLGEPPVTEGVFRVPALAGSWARCSEGLAHPYTGVIRPVTFDHEVARGRDDVVLVHLNHRLVQMCLRLLRAEVWKGDDVKRLHRVTVRAVPDETLNEPAVVVLSRLVVTGGNHHRLHEELTVCGGYLPSAGYRRESSVQKVQQWLETGRPTHADEGLFRVLRERVEKARDAIQQTADARSRDRLQHLGNTLDRKKKEEKADIVQVLDELELGIRKELKKENLPEQLSLFSEDEQRQWRRDTDALNARLARIPKEREQELEAVESRYAGFVARTFPVAVVMLVPESRIGGGRS